MTPWIIVRGVGGPRSFNYLRFAPIKRSFNQVPKKHQNLVVLPPNKSTVVFKFPRMNKSSSPEFPLSTACGQNPNQLGGVPDKIVSIEIITTASQKNDTIGRSVLESVILNRTHYKKTKEGCRGLAAVVVSSFAVGMWCASRNTPLE